MQTTEQDLQQTEEQHPVITEQPATATQPPKPKKQKDSSRFTKKRRWKRWAALGVAVVVAGGVGWKMMTKEPKLPMVPALPIEKGELSNIVGLDGVVKSAQDAQVYAVQSGFLESVNVSVGDRVEAGQILARMDTTDLKMQIAEQQASIKLTQKKNDFAIDLAQKKLTDNRVDIAAGLNSRLIAADSALSSAQQELNAARRDYTERAEDHELADLAMNDARKKLDRAWDAWKEADKNFTQNTGGVTQADVDEKKAAYDDAFDKYNELDKEYGGSLSTEGRNLREARIAYQNALDSRNAIKNAVQREVESLEQSVASTELANDITLDLLKMQRLNKQLGDANITAPISGMVTAVYAKEGAPASGLLFIIEDIDRLVIKTSVQEYDVNLITEGMPVSIKSDATGEDVYEGQVEKIYPTSQKNTSSENTSSKVTFETDVALLSQDSDLRVGMNVRLGITTASKQDVFSVPFDAVITGPDGADILYIAETNEEGRTFVKALPVALGLETDFRIEVSGEGVVEGLLVISDPTMVSPDMEIMNPAQMPAEGSMMGGANAQVVVMG